MKTGQQRRPRTAEEIENNLATLRGIAWNCVAAGIILGFWVHLSNAWWGTPFVFTAITLIYVGTVYAAMRRGYTERYADPTLTFPQLVIGLSNQCFCLWLAPEASIFFLLRIFQTSAFGLFSLSVEQFQKVLYLIAIELFVALMCSDPNFSIPSADLAGNLLLFVTFLLSLNRFIQVASFIADLRARLSAKNGKLRESEARFRSLTELSSDWYWEQDSEMRFLRLESGNDSNLFVQNLLLGKRLWEAGFEVEIDGGWDELKAMLHERKCFRDIIVKRVSPNRKEYFVSLTGAPILDKNGQFKGYRGVAREVTDEKLAAERIQYIATHDGLTGLPNRIMFNQLLSALLQTSHRYEHKFAIMFVDLDGFKRINDTLGHDAGDSLLKEIAARFKQALRTSDVAARLGGDEFVVMLPEMESKVQAATVASKLLTTAAEPLVLAGKTCQVSASIGIAIYPDDGENEHALLNNADRAMYLAKREGRNNFQFFYNAAHAPSVAQHAIDTSLQTRERNTSVAY